MRVVGHTKPCRKRAKLRLLHASYWSRDHISELLYKMCSGRSRHWRQVTGMATEFEEVSVVEAIAKAAPVVHTVRFGGVVVCRQQSSTPCLVYMKYYSNYKLLTRTYM